MEIRTTADPSTDLDGYVREVIAGIQAINTEDTPAPTGPASTSILDCDHLVRRPPIACPLTGRAVWPQGMISRLRVLACGVTDDGLLQTSIFDLQTQQWSAPVIATPEHHVVLRELLFARVGYGNDTLVLCSAQHCYIANVSEAGAQLKHRFDLPTPPLALAVSPDGSLIAIVDDEGKRVSVYKSDCAHLAYAITADEHPCTGVEFDEPESGGLWLGIVDAATNEIGILEVVVDGGRVTLEPKCELRTMPSSAALVARAASTDRELEHDVNERVEWLSLEAPDFVLATRHHLTSNEHAMMDTASALAVFIDDGVRVTLDAAGMVVVLDGEWKLRHQFAPEMRGQLAEPVPQPCQCASCVYRVLHMPSAVMQPVIAASADLRTLYVVDQWAVVRIACASENARITDDK